MNIKKSQLIIIFILSASVASSGVNRKEIDVKSKIERVMVYQDRALVTRKTRPLKFAKGIYEVIFRNIPVRINNDSVRANIDNNENVKILDVEVKTYQLEKVPEEKIQQLKEKFQGLKDEKTVIDNSIRVLELEKEFLLDSKTNFLESSLPGKGFDKGMRRGQVQPARLKVKDYENMLSYLNNKFRKNLEALRKESIKRRKINRKIKFIKSQMSRMNINQSSIPKKKLIKATVNVLKTGSYSLEIAYINYRVKWEPSYDIRVYHDDKKTEFIGYGRVSQNSGEDWLNTKISYSTAQPALRGWLPELVPLYASLSKKLLRQPRISRYSRKSLSQQAMNRAMLDNIVISNKKSGYSGEGLVTDTSIQARSRRQVGSLVFNVLKRSDIKSDGAPHRTAISRQVFPVNFEYLSIPKLSPFAYLQAIGKNSMKTPILKGNLNIFMGNNFVGSSATDNILPGEDFELTLSVNENIRVTRKLDERVEKKAGFLSSTKKIKYSFLIKIENYSGKSIVMNILDQIPVSKEEDLEVEIHKFSHEPAKRDKKGIVKWQFNMNPGEKINLTFSFTLNVPKDKEAAFFKTHMPPSVYLQKLSTGKKRKRRSPSPDDYEMKEKGPAMRQKMY